MTPTAKKAADPYMHAVVVLRDARAGGQYASPSAKADLHAEALEPDRRGRHAGARSKIRTRMCMSLDGYVTTPDGRPAQLADPAWSPEAFGFVDFQASCDAVLMGRTTFEPALGTDRWPWPDLDVFVLGSRRPPGTPDHVVVDSDPARLLAQVRAANRGGDVHLVGGPRTSLIVLPLLLGVGMQLTPSVSADTRPALERQQALPTGAVELVYACRLNASPR